MKYKIEAYVAVEIAPRKFFYGAFSAEVPCIMPPDLNHVVTLTDRWGNELEFKVVKVRHVVNITTGGTSPVVVCTHFRNTPHLASNIADLNIFWNDSVLGKYKKLWTNFNSREGERFCDTYHENPYLYVEKGQGEVA
jgi:hypothetical protein